MSRLLSTSVAASLALACASTWPAIAHAQSPSVIITGPSVVEIGKTYRYKAAFPGVVRVGQRGYWMLPDGTRVDSRTLTYQPKPGETALAFYSYIERQPDATTVTEFPLSTWTYSWPATWTLKLEADRAIVPASIKYELHPGEQTAPEFSEEPLSYTWSLPNGVTQHSLGDRAGFIASDTPGTYKVAVRVADGRGNVTDVYSAAFTVAPPPQVDTRLLLLAPPAGSDDRPGLYYVKAEVVSMPQGDSLLRHDLFIDGVKVGELEGDGHYVSLPDRRRYGILVRTITVAGAYGEATLSVNLATSALPPAAR